MKSISINVKLCVCVCGGGGGSMDSQRAEWILTKLCRHDPWVPTKEEFKFSIKKALQRWLSG